jgi:hypothetical protein
MAHAAPRIGDIADVPRNHVDVGVQDGLPSSGPGVSSDVEAVGCSPLGDSFANPIDQLPDRELLVRGAIEVGLDRLLGEFVAADVRRGERVDQLEIVASGERVGCRRRIDLWRGRSSKAKLP